MKKQITVALGLAVLATPVFASKARLQALGEDTYGSFYINDVRNVFLNAAHVNNHADTVTFEWGDTAEAQDATGTPRAEGGVFRSAGNMTYGVYLGSESNTSNGFRDALGVQVYEENNLDLFIAGDAGMKWGANVTYSSSSKDEAGDTEQSALRTRFGIVHGDLDAWANISLSNKADDGTNEFDGKLSYQVGASYNLNEYRVFGEYRSQTAEVGSNEAKYSMIQVGAGRTSKLNDRATLFTRLQYTMVSAENDASAEVLPNCSGIACDEYTGSALPLVIGLEYDAASWLVLRGSISQSLMGSVEDKDNKSPIHDSTVVNAGASLVFGDLNIDGVIGNNGTTNSGELNTDTLMSRVSMTYRF